MAFCTNCGNNMPDDARFCASCGQQIGARGTLRSVHARVMRNRQSMYPLDYTIQGDNLQVARVRLKPGQEVYRRSRQDALQNAERPLGNQDAGRFHRAEALGRGQAQADGRVALHDLLPRDRAMARSASRAAIPDASRPSISRRVRASSFSAIASCLRRPPCNSTSRL